MAGNCGMESFSISCGTARGSEMTLLRRILVIAVGHVQCHTFHQMTCYAGNPPYARTTLLLFEI